MQQLIQYHRKNPEEHLQTKKSTVMTAKYRHCCWLFFVLLNQWNTSWVWRASSLGMWSTLWEVKWTKWISEPVFARVSPFHNYLHPCGHQPEVMQCEWWVEIGRSLYVSVFTWKMLVLHKCVRRKLSTVRLPETSTGTPLGWLAGQWDEMKSGWLARPRRLWLILQSLIAGQ